VQGIETDSGAFPVFASAGGAASEATGYTVGINWYLNRLIRLQADWEHTRFDAADPATSLPSENVLITRFQLAF
jgi:phosphate-selective porin OprO/OprP